MGNALAASTFSADERAEAMTWYRRFDRDAVLEAGQAVAAGVADGAVLIDAEGAAGGGVDGEFTVECHNLAATHVGQHVGNDLAAVRDIETTDHLGNHDGGDDEAGRILNRWRTRRRWVRLQGIRARRRSRRR